MFSLEWWPPELTGFGGDRLSLFMWYGPSWYDSNALDIGDGTGDGVTGLDGNDDGFGGE